jgi:hypothetical protein
LLLCPTTHAALIRHDPKKANVRIQWALNASATASQNVDILTSPLQKMNAILNTLDMTAYASSKSLVMEYVATIDISEGDGLWLDFGNEYGRVLDTHRSKILGSPSLSKAPRPNSIVLSSDPHPILVVEQTTKNRNISNPYFQMTQILQRVMTKHSPRAPPLVCHLVLLDL